MIIEVFYMAYNILLDKFPNSKFIKLDGGYTNNAVLIEGNNPPLMAKVFNKENKDAITEINAMMLLKNLCVSPLIHDHFEDDMNYYIIMDYISGTNGQKFMDNDDIDITRNIYKQLGVILATKIHTIKQNSTFILPTVELLNPSIEDFIPIHLLKETKSNLKIPVKTENSLIHGDYGPHNTIICQDNIIIIDWEWAGWGNPLQDIAWVLWFVHLHYPHLSKNLSEIFLNAYCSHSNLKFDKTIIKSFATFKVVNILCRIPNGDTETRNEWLRRLEWTLGIDLMD